MRWLEPFWKRALQKREREQGPSEELTFVRPSLASSFPKKAEDVLGV